MYYLMYCRLCPNTVLSVPLLAASSGASASSSTHGQHSTCRLGENGYLSYREMGDLYVRGKERKDIIVMYVKLL